MSFTRGANPIWFFNNLTGMPLDDTYWAFFQENVSPFNPQAVYQDPNGITPWSDPIEFLPTGGLPDNIYGDPTLVYRIEIRQGPTQSDPLIYLIQNYVFEEGGGSSTIISDPLIIAENMITNPQFADIFFASPLTITTAGSYLIAPGWTLVVTGSGSTTLTQGTVPASDDQVTNPSFYLQLANSGWTTVQLIQTFVNNSSIFNNGAIGVAFSAFATGTNVSLNVAYMPNSGNPTDFSTFTVAPGNFVEFNSAINVVPTANSNVGNAASTSLIFNMSGNSNLSISNILFVGQSSQLTSGFDAAINGPFYAEQTYERMVDHEFHVYRNAVVSEPKNSLLTGWNFALNPWQFTTKTVTNVSANQYTADQTIVIQQAYVATATGNNVAVGQASAANNLGLQVTAVTANNQFALLQYIAPQTIAQAWGKIVSAMAKLSLNTTHGTNNVQFKMRLIWNASLPGTISQTNPIAAWTANGDPTTYASGWTAIAPANDPVYTLTTTPTSFPFNKFQLPASSSSTMTLGILIYTLGGLNQAATSDFIVFNDISLVENDFAISTQPQTADEVLRQCQYYYEKSYDSAIPGTAEVTSFLTFPQALSGTIMFPASFTVFFKNTKCETPTVKVYAPGGGSLNNVDAVSLGSSTFSYDTKVTAPYAIANWTISGSLGATGLGQISFVPISGTNHPGGGPNSGASIPNPATSFINLHYSANACLGNPTLP